jgi:hypothetical protein
MLRVLFLLVVNFSIIEGAPSTVFWTTCTTDVYAKGTGHIDDDNYFTPDISILTGPVWFNSRKIHGDWKWSVQIDISFSVFEFTWV